MGFISSCDINTTTYDSTSVSFVGNSRVSGYDRLPLELGLESCSRKWLEHYCLSRPYPGTALIFYSKFAQAE